MSHNLTYMYVVCVLILVIYTWDSLVGFHTLRVSVSRTFPQYYTWVYLFAHRSLLNCRIQSHHQCTQYIHKHTVDKRGIFPLGASLCTCFHHPSYIVALIFCCNFRSYATNQATSEEKIQRR